MFKKMLRRGMTLIEVLVGMLVMGLFLTLAARALVLAYRSTHDASDKAQATRMVVDGLDLMMRDLRLCQEIEQPNLRTTFIDGATISPTITNPLIFARRSSTGNQTFVGYGLDTSTTLLMRLDYSAGYTVGTPPSNTHPIAYDITSLTVTRLKRLTTGNLLYLQVDTTATLPTLTLQIPLQVQTLQLGPGS